MNRTLAAYAIGASVSVGLVLVTRLSDELVAIRIEEVVIGDIGIVMVTSGVFPSTNRVAVIAAILVSFLGRGSIEFLAFHQGNHAVGALISAAFEGLRLSLIIVAAHLVVRRSLRRQAQPPEAPTG